MDAFRTPEQLPEETSSLHLLQSALEDISRALNRALGDDHGDAAMYLRRAQASLKAPLQETASRAAGIGPMLASWQVRKVTEHIEASLGTTIRNKDLATLVRLSEFHFSVAFRNSTGQAPHRFLIERRL